MFHALLCHSLHVCTAPPHDSWPFLSWAHRKVFTNLSLCSYCHTTYINCFTNPAVGKIYILGLESGHQHAVCNLFNPTWCNLLHNLHQTAALLLLLLTPQADELPRTEKLLLQFYTFLLQLPFHFYFSKLLFKSSSKNAFFAAICHHRHRRV